MMQDINRERSRHAAAQTHQEHSANQARKARVRTLIQIGSLVKLTGLFEVCGIKEGDDLQLDMASRDKAAILLGVFMETMRAFSPHPSQQDLDHWQQIGIRVLKQAGAKHYTDRR